MGLNNEIMFTLEIGPDRNPNDPYDQAFDNFFHDWSKTYYANTGRGIQDWGPEVWEPWGFTVENSRVKVVDKKKFTMFLLRWS